MNYKQPGKIQSAALNGKRYSHILDKPYRWETWAAPKGPSTGSGQASKIDHNTVQAGDDLIAFVNGKLFPCLHGFKAKATGPNTIEYKIGEIFGEIKNRIQSGYNLREIIDHVDELRFASQAEKHELSHLYEAKIKNMGNAGRNGGEYYTPRPLIRAIWSAPDIRKKHYITVGVEELDQKKLTPLLLLKYHNSLADAVADLGGRPEEINKVFTSFQKYLYQHTSAA